MLVEVAEDPLALVAGDAEDAGGEALVDIQRAAPGDRVGADHRVLGARVAGFVGDALLGEHPAIDMLPVMQGGQPVQIGLHPVRQRLIGRIHAGEERIAAMRRTFLDVEDAAHRRLEVAGDVGVPAFPIGAEAVLVRLDDHELGVAGFGGGGRVQMELPELPAEIQVLLLRHGLVAEEDDQVFRQRPVDLIHLPVGDGPAEVHPADLGADDGGELLDPDRLEGQPRLGDGFVARAAHGAEGHGCFLIRLSGRVGPAGRGRQGPGRVRWRNGGSTRRGSR